MFALYVEGRGSLAHFWKTKGAETSHPQLVIAVRVHFSLILFWTRRIRSWPPPPTPELLSKDFCLQPGLGWKFLLRRTWSGKNCSHCSFQDFQSLTKGNQVSLVRMHFSHPESMENRQTLGSGVESGSCKRMQLCCLQWSLLLTVHLFAYSCVWELSYSQLLEPLHLQF